MRRILPPLSPYILWGGSEVMLLTQTLWNCPYVAPVWLCFAVFRYRYVLNPYSDKKKLWVAGCTIARPPMGYHGNAPTNTQATIGFLTRAPSA
jgi:hypothetical protein